MRGKVVIVKQQSPINMVQSLIHQPIGVILFIRYFALVARGPGQPPHNFVILAVFVRDKEVIKVKDSVLAVQIVGFMNDEVVRRWLLLCTCLKLF